jgi:hypothetical protein
MVAINSENQADESICSQDNPSGQPFPSSGIMIAWLHQSDARFLTPEDIPS